MPKATKVSPRLSMKWLGHECSKVGDTLTMFIYTLREPLVFFFSYMSIVRHCLDFCKVVERLPIGTKIMMPRRIGLRLMSGNSKFKVT